MGIAITIILLSIVILFLVGLSLETLRQFSGQDSLLEYVMFALFKKGKAGKDPLRSQEEELPVFTANSSRPDTLLAHTRKRG
jgi:hypothetical protein